MMSNTMTLDFAAYPKIQDMIATCASEQGVSAVEAVQNAVNSTCERNILQSDWTFSALNSWGQNKADKEFSLLEQPVLYCEFDSEQMKLIGRVFYYENINQLQYILKLIDEEEEIGKKDLELISPEEVIGCFLIFALEELGYLV